MITAGKPWKLFIERLSWALDGAYDILDIGTDKRFSKELRPLRRLFDGKRYLAAGFKPENKFGEDSCDLDLDVCAIDIPDASFDCAICIEVLEHCAEPFIAAKELQRILRPGGRLFLTVPFLTGYHGKRVDEHNGSHGAFPDYWRFTHQGLERMFSDLEDLCVLPFDGPIEFRLRSTPLVRFVDKWPLRVLLDRYDRPIPGKTTTRHVVTGRVASSNIPETTVNSNPGIDHRL